MWWVYHYFNPRAPRGARLYFYDDHSSAAVHISIHAPLAGRDSCSSNCLFISSYFNPRAPRGARPPANLCWCSHWIFQSTRPSRGATYPFRPWSSSSQISIHAPLAGRDFVLPTHRRSCHAFQSTRPSRGATDGCCGVFENIAQFQSTRPSRGATPTTWRRPFWTRYFNPRAPRGARQQMCTKITYIFALTHKRNTFSCQTPSVRALSKKLSGRFSHKIRCEPPCKTMCAAAPHYTISVPSGRYVCLQPKCSILLSYFFPK